MVDLDAVCEVADALAIVVGMGDYDDLVATVYELAGDLVDVRLDAARLGEEEVANHGDSIRPASHFDDGTKLQLGTCIVELAG